MATDLQRELKETYQGTCTLKSNFECRHLGESSQYNSNCCSEIKPCGIGEGGCSDDAHCMNNLECGTNNCGIPGRSDTRCCRTPWNRPSKQYYHDLNTLFRLFTKCVITFRLILKTKVEIMFSSFKTFCSIWRME